MSGTEHAEESAPLREGPGTRIGPYKLLQQLGEGGFGIVFLAEQAQPVARQVALKIIKLGMDTRQVVARFEQERQALALMDHPNIARVIDAGATETGRPYFVMELVKGAPIGEYCDKNSLTVEERLELFAQVCAAVQHAHQKGIIHRDIKSSNVLVGTQDGKPQVKVIDFGIAKATSAKLTDKTLFTAQQQVIGTLQYMSPEQAEGSLDIDTRTDVYALGVVLYELLTGSTPFDPTTLRDAMYSEIQRMIREVDPPRPSTRLSTAHEELAGIAARRRVGPARLGTLLRGELDWIVMKTLEKDRSRRYDSASSLALDIRRYLAGEAVLAAPPSAVYRLRKFIRRHRVGVAAGAALALSLCAGVVAFAWQASIAAHERDAARLAQKSEGEQRVRAESNEHKAQAINQFLLDMLGSADMRNLGREAKVAEVLDKAALGVGTAFADRPEVEGAVRGILGKRYLSLGMLDAAEPQITRSLELALSLYGESSVEYARGLGVRAALEHGRARREASAATYEKALAILRSAKEPEDPLTLGLQSDYANTLASLKRYPEAEKLLRETLAAHRRIAGQDDRDTQLIVNSLAVLMHDLQRLDEAEPLYREALAIGERVLGQEHPDTLTARMNLGSLLRSRGKIEEAEPLLAKTYAGIEKVYGEAHPKTAAAASVLADLYYAQGRMQDALPLYEKSLAIRRRAEGDSTEAVAQAKQSLALALQRMGDSTRAVTLEREAFETWVALGGAESPKALYARLEFANTLVAAGKTDEAEPHFQYLLERCARILGEDAQTTIIANNSYAVLLLGAERYAEAEPYLRKALETGRRVQGADHRNTLITQCNLGSALCELGRLDEAEKLQRETLEAFKRVFGPAHANLATAHSGLAQTLAKLGHNDEARAEFLEAIGISKAALGAKNPAFSGTALKLATLLMDTGKAADAEPLLREVVEVRTAASGAKDRRTASAQVELAHCLTLQQRFAEAEPLLLAAQPALVAGRPAGHKDVRRAATCLAELYETWNAHEPDAQRAAKALEWKTQAESGR